MGKRVRGAHRKKKSKKAFSAERGISRGPSACSRNSDSSNFWNGLEIQRTAGQRGRKKERVLLRRNKEVSQRL